MDAPALTGDRIYCGTRTGVKAHIGHPGSSVVACGHWLKFNAREYKLSAYEVSKREVCANCLATQNRKGR